MCSAKDCGIIIIIIIKQENDYSDVRQLIAVARALYKIKLKTHMLIVGCLVLTTKLQSMSAIFVGSCRWLSLAAASGDPAVWQAILPPYVGFSHSEFVAVDAICKHAHTVSLCCSMSSMPAGVHEIFHNVIEFYHLSAPPRQRSSFTGL